jgi:hypothetical protein
MKFMDKEEGKKEETEDNKNQRADAWNLPTSSFLSLPE